MYPQNLPKPLNEYLRGEAKVFEALRLQLDNKWTVYSNVIWKIHEKDSNYREGETDFIISHPEFGILVIEVKGGMQIVYHPELDTWNSKEENAPRHYNQGNAHCMYRFGKWRGSR